MRTVTLIAGLLLCGAGAFTLYVYPEWAAGLASLFFGGVLVVSALLSLDNQKSP